MFRVYDLRILFEGSVGKWRQLGANTGETDENLKVTVSLPKRFEGRKSI